MFDMQSLRETLTDDGRVSIEWFFFGLAAQLIIGVCIFIHWYASRKRRRIVIPIPIIYAGLIAAVMLLVYASIRHDFVFVVGQFLVILIGLRILEQIRRTHAEPNETWSTDFPNVEPDTAEINLNSENKEKTGNNLQQRL